MRDYKKYDVWTKAHELCLSVYKEIIPLFPDEEKYALSQQLKRCTYSVPLNIVEGCGRATDKDFLRFLDIALGSVHETEYCALLAQDLTYIPAEKYNALLRKVTDVKAMLINLIKAIRK